MPTTDEHDFRAMLDANGVLRDDATPSIVEARSFLVFSQSPWPKVRSGAWADFAARFCEAKLGITTDKEYGAREVSRDAARVVLSKDDLRGTRLVVGRLANEADVARAEVAELRVAYTGLSQLTKRCKSVWIVECEGTRGEERASDGVALLLAAILAGTELGPILYPRATELVGFKTAFSRVPSGAAPYR